MATINEALQLMIECEGNAGVRYGRMMPRACASRWRVANGKQDGPSSVKESKCKGCPHGEARNSTEATAVSERRELGRLSAKRQALAAPELDERATGDVDDNEPASPVAQEEQPGEQEVEMGKKFGTRTCAYDACGKQYEATGPRQMYCTREHKLAAMRKPSKGGGRVVQRPKRAAPANGAQRREVSRAATPRREPSHDVTPERSYTVRIGRFEVDCRSVDDVIALAERLAQ